MCDWRIIKEIEIDGIKIPITGDTAIGSVADLINKPDGMYIIPRTGWCDPYYVKDGVAHRDPMVTKSYNYLDKYYQGEMKDGFKTLVFIESMGNVDPYSLSP